MNRLIERKQNFSKSLAKLEEALKEEKTDIIVDAVFFRFKFTFELAWKTMKDYLEYLGVINKNVTPREVIKSAFEYGLVKDGKEWIDMMLTRNELSHLYDEETSREIYFDIKNIYIKLLETLWEKLREIKVDKEEQN